MSRARPFAERRSKGAGGFFAVPARKREKVVGERKAKNRTQDVRMFFASSAAALFCGTRSNDEAAKIPSMIGRDGCHEIHRGMTYIDKKISLLPRNKNILTYKDELRYWVQRQAAKKDAMCRRYTRKRLVATANRCEGVYKRAVKEQRDLLRKRRRSGVSAPVTFYKKVAASNTKLAATWRRWRDLNSRDASRILLP